MWKDLGLGFNNYLYRRCRDDHDVIQVLHYIMGHVEAQFRKVKLPRPGMITDVLDHKHTGNAFNDRLNRFLNSRSGRGVLMIDVRLCEREETYMSSYGVRQFRNTSVYARYQMKMLDENSEDRGLAVKFVKIEDYFCKDLYCLEDLAVELIDKHGNNEPYTNHQDYTTAVTNLEKSRKALKEAAKQIERNQGEFWRNMRK